MDDLRLIRLHLQQAIEIKKNPPVFPLSTCFEVFCHNDIIATKLTVIEHKKDAIHKK
jgi:hypothetical protein